MKFLHIIPKLAFALLQLVADLIIVYFLFALIGCFWGRNTNEVLHTTGVPLQIQTDGFHTELYLPVQDSMGLINWMDWFDDTSIRKNQDRKQLISFAFAEYDWTLAGIDQEPKGFGTTFEILFSPWNKSLMHVQWMNQLWPLEKPMTAKRLLSKQQYLQLIGFLQSGFVLNTGRPVTDSRNKRAPLRSNKGYYAFDYVYPSVHNYNSFYTCNQWATDALDAAGIRNAVFSPFGWGLFHQLKK